MTEKEEIQALTVMVHKLTDQLNKALIAIVEDYQQNISTELKPITKKAFTPHRYDLD